MKKTGQKTDYVMKYFSVIRIISAIAIALLIVFAIIFMVSDQPVFAIRKLVLGPLETKRIFFNPVTEHCTSVCTDSGSSDRWRTDLHAADYF